jgi:hypothetical protein
MISIAICTHNELSYLENLLPHLTECIRKSDEKWEIVIVDDNSDEPQFDLVQWTYESWFEEFLKSKQPNNGIQTS